MNRISKYYQDYPPAWPSNQLARADRGAMEGDEARGSQDAQEERGRLFPGLTWQQSVVWCFAIYALYLLWSA